MRPMWGLSFGFSLLLYISVWRCGNDWVAKGQRAKQGVWTCPDISAYMQRICMSIVHIWSAQLRNITHPPQSHMTDIDPANWLEPCVNLCTGPVGVEDQVYPTSQT